MRLIKFRVWDNEFKEYSSYHLNRALIIDANKYDRFLFEQYTGLKDKNGKEIYEGDIINSELNGKGIVQWNNDNSCFEVYIKDNPEDDMYFFIKSFGEVIGNIHENPELL